MKKGDVFRTPDGDHIEVLRAAKDESWADILVTQPHGAWWTKRQPLIEGKFAFGAALEGEGA